MQFLNNAVKRLVIRKFFISRILRKWKRTGKYSLLQIQRKISASIASDESREEGRHQAELLPSAGGEKLWLLS